MVTGSKRQETLFVLLSPSFLCLILYIFSLSLSLTPVRPPSVADTDLSPAEEETPLPTDIKSENKSEDESGDDTALV